jgi:hypothetical protein
MMLSMIEELMRYKWWANAALLHSIEQYPPAAEDEELRKMLNHILASGSSPFSISPSNPKAKCNFPQISL